jgi:hypothetical protein
MKRTPWAPDRKRRPVNERAPCSPFVLQAEEVAHRVSIDHPIGCRGCLFHANGRQMQELVHDLRGHRLDRAPLRVGKLAETRLRLRELGAADLLGAGAQRRDRRNDVERRLPGAELLRFARDDRLPLPPPRRREPSDSATTASRSSMSYR